LLMKILIGGPRPRLHYYALGIIMFVQLCMCIGRQYKSIYTRART
jgi:hypothetical protein